MHRIGTDPLVKTELQMLDQIDDSLHHKSMREVNFLCMKLAVGEVAWFPMVGYRS